MNIKVFDLLKKVKIDGIKINTSDLNNNFLLKSAGKSKLPINLSVGASLKKSTNLRQL